MYSIVISLHASISIGRDWHASLTVMIRVGEVVAVVEIVAMIDSCDGDGRIRRKSISRTIYIYQYCKMLYDKYHT